MREVDRDKSRDYLTKAESSLQVAKFALKIGAYDNAVLSSLHSAINALDALTTLYLGKRSSGSHSDVLGMIKGILNEKEHSDISKQFTSLMSLKNASEYQPDLMRQTDAETSVQRADRILTKVKSKLREGNC